MHSYLIAWYAYVLIIMMYILLLSAVEPPVGISLDAVNQPLAKGYLISPDPVGKGTLWSESSSSEISVLKTLLHWQFTEIRHKNQSTPQETLG